MGGLNDQLNQIVRCLRFCLKTKRELIIDWSEHGLGTDFSKVFSETTFRGVPISCYSSHDIGYLNTLDTAPPFVSGKIDTYQDLFPMKLKREVVFDPDTHANTMTLDEDAKASLIVFQRNGGGTESAKAFAFLRFKPKIGNAVLEALQKLPERYVAIHIRQTDMSSNLSETLSQIKDHVAGQNLLICSDNAMVFDAAREELDASTRILQISEVPQNNGKPLHTDLDIRGSNPYIHSIFVDLIAMANATEIVFPRVGPKNRKKMISGFVRLAVALGKRPHLIKAIFRECDQSLFQSYWQNSPAVRPKSNDLREKLGWHWTDLTS